MRLLFFKAFCLLCVSVLHFLPEAQAAGTSHYVAPNGSGSSCTRQNPCSLNTGISKATPGDEVVLLDGVFRQQLNTVRSGSSGNPIVIRAENHLGAVIRPPTPAPSRDYIARISHSDITLRGLDLNGSRQHHFGLQFGQSGTTFTNVIIEHNDIHDLAGVGVSVQYVRNLTIRHNVIRHTGYTAPGQDNCCGSAFYMGVNTGTGNLRADDVEVYGNTLRDTTANAFDYKEDSRNINVHHNIIEDHITQPEGNGRNASWGDGLIVINEGGRFGNHQFNDNIIRNSRRGTGLGHTTFRMAGNANNKVLRNVVYASVNGPLFRSAWRGTGSASEAAHNTFCNLTTYANHGSGTAGINIHDNRINAPQSACDAEVTRIMNEMKTLPGARYNNTEPPQQQQLASPVRLHLIE